MKLKNAVIGQRVVVKPNYVKANDKISSKHIADIAIGREATIVEVYTDYLTEKVRIKFGSTEGFPTFAADKVSGWWVPHSCLKRIPKPVDVLCK